MSLDPKLIELTKRVELFKGLDPHDVGKIFAKGLTKLVPKGEAVFFQGTVGNTMFVLLGGKVDLYDGKRYLASLSPGDAFGEMAIINREPRTATALAAEDSKVFELSEQTFHKLMTKRVAIQILLNIIGMMSERLTGMNKQMTQLKQQLEKRAAE
jgi:CRP-like cAMP-binding protein